MCQFICSVRYLDCICSGACEESVKFVSNLVFDKQLRCGESVWLFSLNFVMAL